jgi:RNA polymerase sigma-70 factor (ECF subfamily)
VDQTTRLLGLSLLPREGTALVAGSCPGSLLGKFIIVSRTKTCHSSSYNLAAETTNTLNLPDYNGMDIAELKTELESLHQASFGWALNCCRHNRVDAEEVLQTVYLKILQGKALYRGESQLRTWLFAVIRKTAITERRKQVLRSIIGSPSEKSGSQPEVELERSEMQQRFQHALSRLPARQRETLHLVFYQDLSLSEAAEVMNISIGSARRHYERGKQKLREAFDREGVDYGIQWRRKENSGVVL